MVVITGICAVVSLDVVRYRPFLIVLALGKAASSLAALGYYAFDSNAFPYLLNFIVDGILGTGTVTKGSARILATSKKVVCGAFLANAGSVAPVSTLSLAIVAKGQKASN